MATGHGLSLEMSGPRAAERVRRKAAGFEGSIAVFGDNSLAMISDGSAATPAELVTRLGDPHRYFDAFQRLLVLGDYAKDAAIEGLCSPEARVRELCCMVLDHLADSDTFEPLIDALGDPVPEVRVQALHALACDRCKTSHCDLDASALLRATDILRADPDAHVRAMAVELVGKWVHTHPDAADALTSAMHIDPSPAVRKKAAWYAPGGPVFHRTMRRQPRPANAADT